MTRRVSGLAALTALTGMLGSLPGIALANPIPPAPATATTPATTPAAAPSESSVKEAGKHFTRGVSLFGEADYRAALVEFRRAYEIAPNAAVLYNLGQTYYQLQNYAAALAALERYLNESPATASHRHEVEQTIEILRSRVGRVEVKTNVGDAEITVDDELVGKTPLQQPLVVSIGRRKITAMRPGHTPDTRFIDVAAGENTKVDLTLPDADADAAAPHRRDWVTIGWITTGVLAVGALTSGTIAIIESHELSNTKGTVGDSSTRSTLDRQASRVSTFSAIADIAGAAAIIAGGITLTLRWSEKRTQEVHVAVTPNSVIFAGVLP
jgi:hypothetical protein